MKLIIDKSFRSLGYDTVKLQILNLPVSKHFFLPDLLHLFHKQMKEDFLLLTNQISEQKQEVPQGYCPSPAVDFVL